MGNIREKLVFTAFLALFIGGALFLLWRESAQVNLKSGVRLFEASDGAALSVIENGVRKNPHDYLLRYTVARILQKTGFGEMSRDGKGKPSLFEARRNINNALAIRFDSYGHQLLAFNYELTGDELKALAHYNIAFFFAQEADELKRWERLRPRQSESAREYFKADATAVSLIMVYNALTGYGADGSASSAEVFLSGFFLSVSPVEWLNKDWPEGKTVLKTRFEKLGTADQESVARRIDQAGFGFLSRFLLSSV